MTFQNAPDVRGVWIWGESGVGKSHHAREISEGAPYPKLCSKWFDGYQGQKTIIMDDIGPKHAWLGDHIKIWGDKYGCVLETKGGACTGANYTKFIITSQYHPREIWPGDRRTIQAISRRFEIKHLLEAGAHLLAPRFCEPAADCVHTGEDQQ